MNRRSFLATLAAAPLAALATFRKPEPRWLGVDLASGPDLRLRSIDQPAPTITTHGHKTGHDELNLVVEPESRMDRFATGREFAKLKPGEQSEKYFQLVVPHPDEPSPTVTALGGQAGVASVTHPYEKRKFAIAELRRICGFPDDFILKGSYAQQWERLGRSVPPPMMRAIAECVARSLL